MAKEKKRGFFSWLGLGRDEQKETEQAAQQEEIESAAPEAPSAVTADDDAQATLTPEEKSSAEEWLPEDAEPADAEPEHKAAPAEQHPVQAEWEDADRADAELEHKAAPAEQHPVQAEWEDADRADAEPEHKAAPAEQHPVQAEWEDADRADAEPEHKVAPTEQHPMQAEWEDAAAIPAVDPREDALSEASLEALEPVEGRPFTLPPQDAAAPTVDPEKNASSYANLDSTTSLEPRNDAPTPQDADLSPGQSQSDSQPDALSEAELEAAALAAEPQDDDLARQVAAEVEEAALPVEQERPAREGFFARLKRSLVKTRQNLGSGFIGLFHGKKIDDDLFEELEEQLLIADVGVETSRRIINSLTAQASRKQLRDAEALYGLLKSEMAEILAKVDAPLDISRKSPFVILMVGVNGVGKTTTIGKLARQYQSEGKSVMLAAGDTFRAAAVEQLQVWGQRNNIPVVAQHTGADSASVIYDAIQAAKARNVDVLIADTAGRLQNKAHLMEELKKITRVMKKLDEDAPHEVMLTIDASTGQNAISQARLFHEAVNLTGITLTKLDGTAKGGVIFSVADQFGIPIRYIGVGEGIEDLRPFKADDFIEALFARED
ncbi:signal recognition particle-docking protein FtsY [Izhakiella australiensis]|uniref:Signal recognition particle receptor FtsY n=1 Tax=Izhakiella australiensis TaxID=1926881 RepID=A0A1S8YJY2_9GAMM|nr:signal recognition particle-docking protein FtsY [Izhakiella australiensis]OON39394.1 signal recognition particle-docking protein FtsY [Izhakiella australiensis]